MLDGLVGYDVAYDLSSLELCFASFALLVMATKNENQHGKRKDRSCNLCLLVRRSSSSSMMVCRRRIPPLCLGAPLSIFWSSKYDVLCMRRIRFSILFNSSVTFINNFFISASLDFIVHFLYDATSIIRDFEILRKFC